MVQAGYFGAWLAATHRTLRGDGTDAEVPCGDCIGCCTSSYFIHVRPEERATLEAIPPALLVRAPGRPAGHRVLGFSDDGACPMLRARRCSIYDRRPQTCRNYDCRIFAAAGIDAGGDDKALINERVRAWSFQYEADDERRAHDAVRAAARFVMDHAASFPDGLARVAPSDIAVLALKVYPVFLDGVRSRSVQDKASAIIAAAKAFDSTMSARRVAEHAG